MLSNKKNYIIVAHKFLTQPDDELVQYLRDKKTNNILHIRHSFIEAPDRCSFYTWYREGKVKKEVRTKDFKKYPEIFIYAKEAYFTIVWILFSKVKWDVYIGMDGLCVFWGIFLRAGRQIRKTVFWAIDFVPKNRFKQEFKNKIYHWINIQGYKRADELWDLSPRMQEAREKFLGIKKTDYKEQKVVPYGVWTERIKKYTYNECEKTTLVFMGHLIEKQGVQLVMTAMPEIIKQMPDFRFKIIGGGNYKEQLLALAKELKVSSYCDFKGIIEDHREVEREIAKSCVAIAPYIKKLDTWTYYADPGKVKTYLACGVPVLLTEIPWNAKAIEKSKCGKIIREERKDIINNLLFLMDKKRNQEYRINAIKFSEEFNYRQMFDSLSL